MIGVVGAGHLPGIAREWPTVGSPESVRRAAEYVSPPPADAPDTPRQRSAMQTATTAVLAATGLALALRRPKLALGVSGFVFGASAVGLAAAAAGVRKVERCIAAIDVASRKLAEQGDSS
jgi:threonine dehydrogenase-like Zn-dependent dehydrogenase